MGSLCLNGSEEAAFQLSLLVTIVILILLNCNVIPSTAMKVNASNTATMECADYFTTSSLRTSWTVIKNEERLQVPVSGRFIQNGSHLTIQEVEVQDSGRYECLIVDVQEKTLSQRETTLEVIGEFSLLRVWAVVC